MGTSAGTGTTRVISESAPTEAEAALPHRGAGAEQGFSEAKPQTSCALGAGGSVSEQGRGRWCALLGLLQD